MPSCPSCGKSIADGAGFCAYCGASATTSTADQSPGATVQRSAADYWVCGSCHSENLVGDAFCQTCGVARAAAGRPSAASSPAPPVPPTAPPFVAQGSAAYEVTCTSCGTANEPDASFCHACGLPLVARTAGSSAPPAWATPSPATTTSGSGRWIVLVAAIVAVAAAVVIGIVLLGDRGDGGAGGDAVAPAAATVDDTATDTSDDTSDTTTTPTERDVTDYVTSVRSRTCLAPDEGNTYNADNLTDGVMSTCWAEGVSGFGIGETVRFRFSPRVTLTRMEVVPGYDKYANGWDRWLSNGRLRQITVTFADDSQEAFSFSDDNRWQDCGFGSLKTGSSLEFTVDDVFHPDRDNPHYAEDTSVSEVRFYGWLASEGGE